MTTDLVRVLLVEDNPADALWLKEALDESNGMSFSIRHVETLAEARRCLARESFHVLIVDLGLPDSQGLETFRAIRDIHDNAPVIVMSGLDDESVAIETVREGAQDYLVKDRWESDVVRRSLRYAIERHRLYLQCKRGEDALRRSEERFRAIFEGAQDPIWVEDKDLRITHVNPAMERSFGRPANQLIGLGWEDLFGTNGGEYIREVDMRVLQGESIEKQRTLSVGGAKAIWNIVQLPMRNESGEITGLCGMARDVTDWQQQVWHKGEVHYPSQAMASTLKLADYGARKDSIILLLGESGSGKDYLARWIHDRSKRADGPYFSINCAAISRELAESELFGHEKGAFTGAMGRKRGLLELAEGGTLLLNEIGELPLPLQAKLLTFLDTRKITRVGGERLISVNARLIGATNRDLKKEVEENRFRKDLFYRINVMPIRIPPLRERRDDIPILVQEIVARLQQELQIEHMPVIDSGTMNRLKEYHWPGNVRELRNVLERAVILSSGGALRLELPAAQTPSCQPVLPDGLSMQEVLDDLARSLCTSALELCKGNKKNAARKLGISRDTLYRYLKKFGMDTNDQA